MDARHFDVLTRALSESGTRRGLLAILTTLPVLGGLFALLDHDAVDAKGRRKRRKKAHKHGKGRRRKHHKKCNAESKGKTCAATCGPVVNNCKKTVDCGSCACPAPCEICFICQEGPNTQGTCVADPDQVGDPCGSDGKTCQANGECVCIPVDPCTGEACGTVTGNCGQSITCDPCPVIISFTFTPGTIDRGASPPETASPSWATSDATSCTLDDGTGPEDAPCNFAGGFISPAVTTTYTLTASGASGAQVTAQATVTVEYCHAITTSQVACPSGATELCLGVPIVATNASHAQAACEACYGAGACQDETGCSASWWQGPGSPFVLAFQYTDNAAANPGDIVGGGGAGAPYPPCSLTGSRWAP